MFGGTLSSRLPTRMGVALIWTAARCGRQRSDSGMDPLPVEGAWNLTIVSTALAVSRIVQNRTGHSIRKVLRDQCPLR